MSSLWTPEGEHPVGPRRSDTPRGTDAATSEPASPPPRTRAAASAGEGDLTAEELSEQEQLAAHLEGLRRELVSTPAEIVVANHVYGLFELAAIHLSEKPPRLDDARLAIDAMASVVDGLSGRLGEPEPSLREALSQIRIAFVEIGGSSEATS